MKLRACQDGDPPGSPSWQCRLALAPTCSDVKPGAASFGSTQYVRVVTAARVGRRWSEVARLRERLLAELDGAAAEATALIEATIASVDDFAGSVPQSDDITLLALRYLRAPSRPAPTPNGETAASVAARRKVEA